MNYAISPVGPDTAILTVADPAGNHAVGFRCLGDATGPLAAGEQLHQGPWPDSCWAWDVDAQQVVNDPTAYSADGMTVLRPAQPAPPAAPVQSADEAAAVAAVDAWNADHSQPVPTAEQLTTAAGWWQRFSAYLASLAGAQ
ncbi:MAG: hypothetical protein KGL39_46805 [Patescibacteria group bacterium]|nr:hypothetical protein [Patescibacteria group bacterium]